MRSVTWYAFSVYHLVGDTDQDPQEIATKLIQSTVHTDANGNPVNPIDAQFLSLGLATMDPIMRGGSEFSVLEDYVKHTHGSTHGHIRYALIRWINHVRISPPAPYTEQAS